MAAKRTRCICGTIYDPTQQQVCPSCAEPYHAAPPAPPPEPEQDENDPEKIAAVLADSSAAAQEKIEKVRESVQSNFAALRQRGNLARERWLELSPQVRRKILIGAG